MHKNKLKLDQSPKCENIKWFDETMGDYDTEVRKGFFLLLLKLIAQI